MRVSLLSSPQTPHGIQNHACAVRAACMHRTMNMYMPASTLTSSFWCAYVQTDTCMFIRNFLDCPSVAHFNMLRHSLLPPHPFIPRPHLVFHSWSQSRPTSSEMRDCLLCTFWKSIRNEQLLNHWHRNLKAFEEHLQNLCITVSLQCNMCMTCLG